MFSGCFASVRTILLPCSHFQFQEAVSYFYYLLVFSSLATVVKKSKVIVWILKLYISVLALLLSGGLYNSSVVPMNFVELWSPDRQCSLDPLPFPMEGHTTDWVDNSLVVCGGLNGSSWTTAPCTRFKNGTWQPLKNTKHQR